MVTKQQGPEEEGNPAEIQAGGAPDMRELGGLKEVNRTYPGDIWLPHLTDDLQPYIPGSHIVIPPGLEGAVLSSNENPYPPAPSIIQGIIAKQAQIAGSPSVLEDGLRTYVDDDRILRENVAQYFGYGVKPEMIMASSGASQIIHKLIAASDPKKGPIMAFMPGFFYYPIAARQLGKPFIGVPLNSDMSYPHDRFMEMLDEKDPALTFLDTPNNPVGCTIPEKNLREICTNRAKRNGMVVIDQAYYEYTGKPGGPNGFDERAGFSALSMLDEFPNLVVLRTFSKAQSLAGARLGFSVSSAEMAARMAKYVKTPFEINPISMAAGILATKPEALDYMRPHLAEAVSERERVFKELQGVDGITPFPSQANFILVNHRELDKNPAEFAAALQEENIHVRPMPMHAFPPEIRDAMDLTRITIGTPMQNDWMLRSARKVAEG